jgi:hypothetical protein
VRRELGSGARHDRLRAEQPRRAGGLSLDQIETDAAGEGRRVAREQRRCGLDSRDFLDEVVEDPALARYACDGGEFGLARDDLSVGPSFRPSFGTPLAAHAFGAAARRQQLDVVRIRPHPVSRG